jgi:hypothetical protein
LLSSQAFGFSFDVHQDRGLIAEQPRNRLIQKKMKGNEWKLATE